MEYFTLYNGVKIPKVGFGTYKVIDNLPRTLWKQPFVLATAIWTPRGCT